MNNKSDLIKKRFFDTFQKPMPKKEEHFILDNHQNSENINIKRHNNNHKKVENNKIYNNSLMYLSVSY